MATFSSLSQATSSRGRPPLASPARPCASHRSSLRGAGGAGEPPSSSTTTLKKKGWKDCCPWGGEARGRIHHCSSSPMSCRPSSIHLLLRSFSSPASREDTNGGGGPANEKARWLPPSRAYLATDGASSGSGWRRHPELSLLPRSPSLSLPALPSLFGPFPRRHSNEWKGKNAFASSIGVSLCPYKNAPSFMMLVNKYVLIVDFNHFRESN